MAKKVTGYLKLQVPAGAANPSPPIGPALGQRGLNIMEFCKAFNAQTQKEEKNTPIPVVITIYADRSFTFEMKTPPMSFFLKQAAKIQSGSKAPGRDKAGAVTKAQVREIAERIGLVGVDALAGLGSTFCKLRHRLSPPLPGPSSGRSPRPCAWPPRRRLRSGPSSSRSRSRAPCRG